MGRPDVFHSWIGSRFSAAAFSLVIAIGGIVSPVRANESQVGAQQARDATSSRLSEAPPEVANDSPPSAPPEQSATQSELAAAPSPSVKATADNGGVQETEPPYIAQAEATSSQEAPLPPVAPASRPTTESDRPAQTPARPLGDLGVATPFKVEVVPAESFLEKQAVAILALAVSIGGFWFTSFMTSRTRKQSIHDDFWMRQVTYPRIVEPIIQYMAEVTRTLPAEATAGAGSPNAGTFGLDFAAELERLRASLVLLLATMSQSDAKSVYDTMNAALSDIEDAITEYCSLHSSPLGSGPPLSTHTGTLQAIQEGMGKLVKSLLDVQQNT